MKKLKIAIVFLLILPIAKSYAQDARDFQAFGNRADSLIQDAYNKKDVARGLKYIDEFLDGYNKLSDRDKEDYKGFLEGDYYNLSCTYSLLGDNKNALDYLEKSRYYNYQHLQEDHDMDNIRKEPRFIKFLDEAKKQGELYNGAAFKTTYKANLSDEEKIAGLSQLWSQAKYNFVYFDHADIDWDKSYGLPGQNKGHDFHCRIL